MHVNFFFKPFLLGFFSSSPITLPSSLDISSRDKLSSEFSSSSVTDQHIKSFIFFLHILFSYCKSESLKYITIKSLQRRQLINVIPNKSLSFTIYTFYRKKFFHLPKSFLSSSLRGGATVLLSEVSLLLLSFSLSSIELALALL